MSSERNDGQMAASLAFLLARPDGVPATVWPPGPDAAAALSAGVASTTGRTWEPRRAALAA